MLLTLVSVKNGYRSLCRKTPAVRSAPLLTAHDWGKADSNFSAGDVVGREQVECSSSHSVSRLFPNVFIPEFGPRLDERFHQLNAL